MEIPIGSGYYEYGDRGFDYRRCINFFPRSVETADSKTNSGLKPTPGQKLAVTVVPNSGNGARGMYATAGGRLFSVWGDTLYEIDINETATDRNPLLRFSRLIGSVSMSDNGTQLIIIDQGKGYILTLLDNTIVEITDVDYPTNANQVVFKDEYFVLSVPNSKDWYVSGINDGTTWSSLDVAQIVSKPDEMIGVVTTNTNLVLFGEKTIESWQKVTNKFFPFQRIEGAVQDIGCVNPWSISNINNTIYWLGNNKNGSGIVWRMKGYQVEQVSTRAIEEVVGTALNQTNAIAYSYQEKGYAFYVLSLPSIERTFAFEEKTGKWHERAYWDSANSKFLNHKSSYHAFAYGKNYVSYDGDDNLYDLDDETRTDNGDAIVRLFTTAHISLENKKICVHKAELEMERGVGNTNSPGEDPMAKLRYSQDGGYTYSNQIMRHIGKSGKFSNEIQWNRLGIDRDYVLEFSFSAPVNIAPHSLYLDLEVLKV